MGEGSLNPCFFCAQTGVKLTGEHVWREKWQEHYGSRPFTARQWGWTASGTKQRPYDRRYPAKPFSQRLRDVCETCNNGWMNSLENEAGQVLLSLFNGERLTLTPEDALPLVRWAAKTAFVIAGTDGGREPETA